MKFKETLNINIMSRQEENLEVLLEHHSNI